MLGEKYVRRKICQKKKNMLGEKYVRKNILVGEERYVRRDTLEQNMRGIVKE